MLKCLVSENDTVVETLLSESVLEEEYLQEEVRKLSYLRTLRHRDTIWRTRIKMQRNENTTHCQGADWHGSLARGGGSPPLQGSKCERMSWHSCHSKIQTRENKRFFAALAQRVARCLFWLSRRDRDFASFSLVPRDKIEIFVHWISGFETRSRFSVI